MNIKTYFGKSLAVIAVALFSFGLLASFASVASAAITTITNVTPNSGLNKNGDIVITWSTDSGILSSDKVDIYYSTNDFGVETKLTTSNIPASDGTYTWNTITAGIPDSNNYKIKVADVNSLVNGISISAFTIDNTAPTFTITSSALGTPTNPVQTTGNINVTVDATVSGLASTRYGFSNDSTCDATDDWTSTETGSFTSGRNFTISGDHTDYLCVKATDKAGNTGYKDVGQLNTDNTTPTLNSITPAGGSDLSGTQTFTFDFNDTNLAYLELDIYRPGDTLNTRFQITLPADNALLQTGLTGFWSDCSSGGYGDCGITSAFYDSATQKWTVVMDTTNSFWPEGTTKFYVEVGDSAGNQWGDMNGILGGGLKLYTYIFDNTLPTFTIDNGTATGPVQNDTINITTDDATSGVASQEYGFSSDATCDSSDTYGNAFTSGIDFSIAGDHIDYLCAEATDNAGNVGYQLVGQLNTDNTAPNAPAITGITDDTGFSSSDGITNDDTLVFNGTTPTDTTGIEIFKDEVSIGTGLISSGSWSFDYTGTTLSEGTYAVTAKATDVAGNQSTASPVFTLVVDTTPITSVISSYTFDSVAGNWFFNPGTVTLGLTASEPVTWVSVQFQKVGDSSIYKTYFPGAPYDGTTSATQAWDGLTSASTPAPDGTYEVKVHVQDLAGNDTTVVLGAYTVTVDTVDPDITDFDKPAADTVYTSPPPLNFTPGDVGGLGTLKCSYSLDGGTDVPVSTCTAGTATGATETIPGLTDGRHTIDVKVTDQAGNTVTSTSGPVSFVYDDNHILTVNNATNPTLTPDFTTIQGAIDAAVTGITTIQVATGNYPENVDVNKSLVILGANKDVDPNAQPTSRTASDAGESIIKGLTTISADDVSVNGFTITNSNGGLIGIDVSPNRKNGKIKNNFFDNIGGGATTWDVRGIYLEGGSQDITVSNNNFGNLSSTAHGADAIFIGYTSTAVPDSNIIIDNNVIDGINVLKGAYGVLVNNGAGSTGLEITNNTFTNLKGGWTHAIGLEGDTPSAVITGNTFSNLVTISPTSPDKVGVFFQDNPSAASVTVSGNQFNGLKAEFGGVGIHEDDLPGGANGYSYTVNAENNWWGDASGPFDGPLAGNKNPNGLGTYVTTNVDYSPFYNDPAMAVTNLVSVDPIASFVLSFSPDSLVANGTSSSILKVTAKDAGGYTVVNDSTTSVNLNVVSGTATLINPSITMEADGDTTTTITSNTVGTASVRATDSNNYSANGDGTITFTAGPVVDTTPPVVNNFSVSGIITTGATLNVTTDENATCRYSTIDESYANMSNTFGTLAATTNTTNLTGLTANTSYTYYVRCKDTAPAGNTLTSSANATFMTDAVVNTTAPTIMSTNPVDGTIGESSTVSPSITFSKQLDSSTIDSTNIKLYKYSNNSEVPAVVSLVEGGKTVVINPIANLENGTNGTQYYYAVSTGVKDTSGNNLVTAWNSSNKADHEFTTATIDPITINSITAVKNSATADNKYIDGWHYVYKITVNTNETNLKVDFTDWIKNGGLGTIPTNGNTRLLFNSDTGNGLGSLVGSVTEADITDGFGTIKSYEIGNNLSDQKLNGTAQAIGISGLDTSTDPGRQVQFDVYTKLPLTTPTGFYTTSYYMQTL